MIDGRIRYLEVDVVQNTSATSTKLTSWFGTMITAKRQDKKIMRNYSHFKEYTRESNFHSGKESETDGEVTCKDN